MYTQRCIVKVPISAFLEEIESKNDGELSETRGDDADDGSKMRSLI